MTGNELSTIMQSQSISDAQLAEAIGVTRQTVHRERTKGDTQVSRRIGRLVLEQQIKDAEGRLHESTMELHNIINQLYNVMEEA